MTRRPKIMQAHLSRTHLLQMKLWKSEMETLNARLWESVPNGSRDQLPKASLWLLASLQTRATADSQTLRDSHMWAAGYFYAPPKVSAETLEPFYVECLHSHNLTFGDSTSENLYNLWVKCSDEFFGNYFIFFAKGCWLNRHTPKL